MNRVKKLRLPPGFGGIILITGVVAALARYTYPDSFAATSPKLNSPPLLTLHSLDIPIATSAATPSISAESAIVFEPNSGTVLFSKNADTPRYPASTTKIMTALVALDHYSLDEVVTITNASQSIGHTADLVSSEKITVQNLLYALMVSSGNDAAVALAQHHPQGYQHFIKLMNIKASQLNLHSTHFTNASGIENSKHYSTARDLSILAKAALENPTFSQIVATKQITVSSIDGAYTHQLTNLNELLGKVPGVIGVKTGWTSQAGECLVTYTIRDGKPIITVVLKSLDRFGDSTTLIEWAYANHLWLPQSELLQSLSR